MVQVKDTLMKSTRIYCKTTAMFSSTFLLTLNSLLPSKFSAQATIAV